MSLVSSASARSATSMASGIGGLEPSCRWAVTGHLKAPAVLKCPKTRRSSVSGNPFKVVALVPPISPCSSYSCRKVFQSSLKTRVRSNGFAVTMALTSTDQVTKEHSLGAQKECRSAGVPVFVMMPLDSIKHDNSVNRKRAINASLQALRSAGVEGIMVDVWWGLVEREAPGEYNWNGYRELLEMIKRHGLKVQAVMSFHQCGGNVGDSVSIPLPKWVMEEMERDNDLAYTDQEGRRNFEYVSLGADCLPLLKGRTPIQCYADFMRSFRDNFEDLMGNTILEIQVGMGPAGELRYPSYPEANGTWKFPGIGAFQCYDKYMLAQLKSAAESIKKPEWGHGGPSDAGQYNNWPEDAPFFKREGGWNSDYGQFFLSWYSTALLKHGERILSEAQAIFRRAGVKLSGKVAGIHWHYGTRSHAPELTAGYYNTRFRDGYEPIAKLFANFGVVFNFTCIEMKDYEQPQAAQCSPEKLIKQVVLATRRAGVHLAGENALLRFDQDAHNQILRNASLRQPEDDSCSIVEPMCAFTFLRMCPELFQSENWRLFVSFVRKMAQPNGLQGSGEQQRREADHFLHVTGPLLGEASSAFV